MANFKKYHSMLLLIIVVAVTIITSGCVSNTNNEIDTKDDNPVTVPNNTPNKENVSQNNIDDTTNEELYRLFLENSVNVNIDNSEYSLTQYIEGKGASGMKFEYTFFDMNGDGITEFHLKSPRSYDIFTINDERIKLWYEGSAYENFTSDGNILYCRHGGAPNNEQYIFKELDSDGNVVSEVSWSVYELDNRGSITSNSVFYNGDGEEISEDEYYELIGKYDKVIYNYEWFVFYENLTTMIWENIDEEKQTNITIQYPALHGMNDENLQDKINTTIKEAARSKYNDFLDMGLDFDKTAWPVEYTVEYMSDRYISVVFNGYIYTMGAAHGTDWKYAVTVDMTTGEKVKLSDIFDDSFIDYLTFENFGECIEIDFSGAFSEATDLIFANMKDEFARDWDNLSYDYFHFANDSFHITYAPQSSFFCFKSGYEALTPCMKDHPIWQELGVQSPNDEDFSLIYNGFTFSYDTTIDEITSFFPTSERWEEPQNYLFVAGCPTSRRISLNYPDGHNPDISVICVENLETGESFIERIIVCNDETVEVTSGEYINAYEGVLGKHIYEFELHIDSPESLAIDLYQKSLTGEDVSLLPFDGKINLLYASGAGAWGDYITLSADGSYTRNFHDVNMGEIGEANPNGTVYFDNETGKFELLKLDDYTYMLTVKESTHEYGYLEEWIEDGVKYVSTAPEHSDVGTIYILALPGKPIQEIPISVMEWDLDRSFGYVTESTLTYYALYPYSGGIGYFAYEYINDEENEENPKYP